MVTNIDNCLEVISHNKFFILDDTENKPAYINYEKGQFMIIKKIDNEISFLKIDNCLKFENDDQKCDCAVFDNNTFCFIELKTMTSDKTPIKNKRRKKAESQLKNTINNFENNEIIKDKNLEAYVSITCKVNDELTKVTNISNKEMQVEFLEEYKTKLYYKCEKEFN